MRSRIQNKPKFGARFRSTFSAIIFYLPLFDNLFLHFSFDLPPFHEISQFNASVLLTWFSYLYGHSPMFLKSEVLPLFDPRVIFWLWIWPPTLLLWPSAVPPTQARTSTCPDTVAKGLSSCTAWAISCGLLGQKVLITNGFCLFGPGANAMML